MRSDALILEPAGLLIIIAVLYWSLMFLTGVQEIPERHLDERPGPVQPCRVACSPKFGALFSRIDLARADSASFEDVVGASTLATILRTFGAVFAMIWMATLSQHG